MPRHHSRRDRGKSDGKLITTGGAEIIASLPVSAVTRQLITKMVHITP